VYNDKKVTSTPVGKGYEHGFYPLQGRFKVDPNDPNPDPNNTDKKFQVLNQWLEVLPTDQMVPVEVTTIRSLGGRRGQTTLRISNGRVECSPTPGTVFPVTGNCICAVSTTDTLEPC